MRRYPLFRGLLPGAVSVGDTPILRARMLLRTRQIAAFQVQD